MCNDCSGAIVVWDPPKGGKGPFLWRCCDSHFDEPFLIFSFFFLFFNLYLNKYLFLGSIFFKFFLDFLVHSLSLLLY